MVPPDSSRDSSAGPSGPPGGISLPRAICYGLIPAAVLGFGGILFTGYTSNPRPVWVTIGAIGALLSAPIYLFGWAAFMLHGGARSWKRSIVLALLFSIGMSTVLLSLIFAGCSWLEKNWG